MSIVTISLLHRLYKSDHKILLKEYYLFFNWLKSILCNKSVNIWTAALSIWSQRGAIRFHEALCSYYTGFPVKKPFFDSNSHKFSYLHFYCFSFSDYDI